MVRHRDARTNAVRQEEKTRLTDYPRERVKSRPLNKYP